MNKINKLEEEIRNLKIKIQDEANSKLYWRSIFYDLEEFTFKLIHTSNKLNDKYGIEFDNIRNNKKV